MQGVTGSSPVSPTRGLRDRFTEFSFCLYLDVIRWEANVNIFTLGGSYENQ